jgi:hypothetical protein
MLRAGLLKIYFAFFGPGEKGCPPGVGVTASAGVAMFTLD